ncbi:MAG: polynucleotide adenylyltransferase, partial [Oscillospiraceae bacterium]|nr:polynucleotide adenylyltransferase [Oscillospiraceae bacterium]
MKGLPPMKISVPEEVRFIIDTLEKSGYDAYAVGGCVRDALLGLEPSDWDICTRATPEQTAKSFEGVRIIETGLRHGTLTLLLNNRPFEITTFRVDGVYSDGRRPDNVKFTDDLKADLSRRDFTINAMAYNPEKGVVDFFGG